MPRIIAGALTSYFVFIQEIVRADPIHHLVG